MSEAHNHSFSPAPLTPSYKEVKNSRKHGGRLPGLYTHEIVKYKEKEYAVITIQHKKNEVRFIIDNCNLTQVLTKPWHLSSGKYIATHYTSSDGKSKELYLHNFIKDNCMNESSEDAVVHINHNMLDNRIENLRVIKSYDYFPLRNNRKRIITLPENSGFTVDDIPKYVSFMKSSGEHGDRFAIEIPQLNLFIKMPSSKKISLKEKFEQTKERLNEIYQTYPHINPQINDALKLELNTSFQEILEINAVAYV